MIQHKILLICPQNGSSGESKKMITYYENSRKEEVG
jgi:hypothetical protein